MPRVYVLVLLLALSVAPASAQRRGGGGGGGMRGGGGGGHVAMRGPAVGFRGGFNTAPHFTNRGFAGPHRTMVPVRRYYPHYPYRYLYGYGAYYGGYYGYPYASYGYPYYGSVDYSTSDTSYDQQAYYQNQQLSQQVSNLSSEVRDLHDQNDQLRYDLEKRRYRGDDPPRPSPVPQASQPTPETPAAVFIFKTGVSLDAHNYAIVGQTLWILSPQRALKYPLAQLDYDATKKANADRGLDVTLPALASTPAKPTASSTSPLHGD